MKRFPFFASFCLPLLSAVAFLSLPASAAEDTLSSDEGWVIHPDTAARSYRFADGSLATGETTIENVTYLFAPNGIQQLGWQSVSGKRLYFDPDTGQPLYGLIHWRGAAYYISPETGKSTGEWLSLDEGICLTDSSGVLHTGWAELENGRFYFDSEGFMQTGLLRLSDGIYLLGDDGSMIPGLLRDGGTLCFRNPDGSLLQGWYTDDSAGDTYYFGADGNALRGLQEIDGDTYYFNGAGIMQRGLLSLERGQMYFDESGRRQTGLMTIDGECCYFQQNGLRMKGTAADGILADGTARIAFQENGAFRFGYEIEGDTLRYMSPYGVITEENAADKTTIGLCYYAICALTDDSWRSEESAGSADLLAAYLEETSARSTAEYYQSASVHDTAEYCPWNAGTLVFRSESGSAEGISHLGIYIGYDLVVEVLESGGSAVLTAGRAGWTHWAFCSALRDTAQQEFLLEDGNVICKDRSGAELFRFETEGEVLRYSEPEDSAREVNLYAKTNLGLAYYVIHKLGLPYWQGCYGQIASKALWDLFYPYAPKNYTRWDDYTSQYGQQVFDCIGLVKSYLWSRTVDSAPVVDWSQAVNESQMYELCTPHGTIESCPWTVGTLVFRADESSTRPNKVHHVGVYIGHGMVIEARGHIFGVCLTRDLERWTHWGQCPWTVG